MKLAEAYNAGFLAAFAKLGMAMPMAGDTAATAVSQATAPPQMTRSLDNFTGLSTKNRNISLATKRGMPKSMINTAMKVLR